MKKLLAIIILSLCFITSSKADDIKDFQIEGMSIGDSLLNFFDKELIEAEKNDKYSLMYKNNEYVQIGASYKTSYPLRIDSNTYDDLSIILKTNDDNYKIVSIGGRIMCIDMNICKSKKNEIVSELKIIFGDNVTIRNFKKNHAADPSGNSKNFSTTFDFKSNDYVQVSIYDWSQKLNDEKSYPDNLKVTIVSAEFRNFLENIQYN